MLKIVAKVVGCRPDDSSALTHQSTQSAINQPGNPLQTNLMSQLDGGVYCCVGGNSVEFQQLVGADT